MPCSEGTHNVPCYRNVRNGWIADKTKGRFNCGSLCSSSFEKILISISEQVQLPRCVSFERGAMH